MSTCLSHLWDEREYSGGQYFDFAKLLEELHGEPKAEIEETVDDFLSRINREINDDELLEK